MHFSSLLGNFDNIFTMISPKISSLLHTLFVSSVTTRFLCTECICNVVNTIATREMSRFDIDTLTVLFNGHSSDDFRLIIVLLLVLSF